MLKQYLTNIFMMRHNLNTIHFNVVGDNAYDLHLKTGEWGKYFEEYYDTIAERIKMLNNYPIVSLSDIKEISTIKELPGKDINAAEGLNIIINDLKLLNSMSKQVGDYVIANKDLYMINIISEFIKYLDKIIWLNTLSKLNKNE